MRTSPFSVSVFGPVFAAVWQDKIDILAVDHKTGHLIFEYNRLKEVDKEAFREYGDLLIEILSRKN